MTSNTNDREAKVEPTSQLKVEQDHQVVGDMIHSREFAKVISEHINAEKDCKPSSGGDRSRAFAKVISEEGEPLGLIFPPPAPAAVTWEFATGFPKGVSETCPHCFGSGVIQKKDVKIPGADVTTKRVIYLAKFNGTTYKIKSGAVTNGFGILNSVRQKMGLPSTVPIRITLRGYQIEFSRLYVLEDFDIMEVHLLIRGGSSDAVIVHKKMDIESLMEEIEVYEDDFTPTERSIAKSWEPNPAAVIPDVQLADMTFIPSCSFDRLMEGIVEKFGGSYTDFIWISCISPNHPSVKVRVPRFFPTMSMIAVWLRVMDLPRPEVNSFILNVNGKGFRNPLILLANGDKVTLDMFIIGGKKGGKGKKPKKQNKPDKPKKNGSSKAMNTKVNSIVRASGGWEGLSPCVRQLALAFVNPFDKRTEGVCLPSGFVARTNKAFAYSVFGAVSSNVGSIYFFPLPNVSSDGISGFLSNNGTAMTDTSALNPLSANNTVDTANWLPMYAAGAIGYGAANFNSDANTGQAIVQGRLVCAGYRATYTGKTIDEAGMWCWNEEVTHGTLAGYSMVQIQALQNTRQEPISKRKPFVNVQTPIRQEELNFRVSSSSTQAMVYGFASVSSYPLVFGSNTVRTFTQGGNDIGAPSAFLGTYGMAPTSSIRIEQMVRFEMTGSLVQNIVTPNPGDIQGTMTVVDAVNVVKGQSAHERGGGIDLKSIIGEVNELAGMLSPWARTAATVARVGYQAYRATQGPRMIM
jgi:hypothetical protein